jgi:phospholipid transport system substrate-binding protein
VSPRIRSLALLVSLLALAGSPSSAADPDDDASPPATRDSRDAGSAAAGDQTPLATPAVERLHAALLGIMRSADELGYEGRFETLDPVVAETFDMPFMASKSVGRHWNELPEADQKRWLDVFARHVTATYAGQFTGYTGETFETLGEEPATRDTRVVRTRLTRPGEEDVHLNYRLREVGGKWRIIDIYLNGTVSELALRRSEYSSVLKREGFEKLVSTIAERVKDLAAGSTS